MEVWKIILIAAAVGAAFGVVGFILGGLHRKRVAEAAIGSATKEANRIVSEAMTQAEAKKKEAILEAKDEIHKQRSENEKELRERRNEVQRQERRIIQKEESLDKKIENLEKKDESLSRKIKDADDRLAEAESLKRSQLDVLEKISGYSREQAKEYLLQNLENDLVHEKAVKVLEYQQRTKDEADTIAREIIGTAIQRCAADHTAETTVSVVALHNDEMKGRIIGREGRNVRTLETITGVDLIIDDTPEAITVSSFDPVRREVARLTLEKLISDGRIHPARIEEMVEKARREVEATIRAEGERAVLETGVRSLHPELQKLLGKLHYRTSYGQNVLQHSIEVSHIAGMMAAELGADVQAAKRAGLLHDLGKAIDHDVEGPHAVIGAELARRYGEKPVIVHAIEAHHADVDPNTVLDVLVQAADAVSASRPGARRESAENYIKRLEKLEEIANSHEGVERTYAMQAGREVHVMVQPDKISDAQSTVLAHDIAHQIEEEMEYPGQVRVVVIRESRAVDIAK